MSNFSCLRPVFDRPFFFFVGLRYLTEDSSEKMIIELTFQLYTQCSYIFSRLALLCKFMN